MKRPADEYWCKDRGDFTPYSFGQLILVIEYYRLGNLTGKETREELISILWDNDVDAYCVEEMLETIRDADRREYRRFRAPKKFNETTGQWEVVEAYREWVEKGGEYPLRAVE